MPWCCYIVSSRITPRLVVALVLWVVKRTDKQEQVDISPHLDRTTEVFQSYIQRGLRRVAEQEAARSQSGNSLRPSSSNNDILSSSAAVYKSRVEQIKVLFLLLLASLCFGLTMF